MAREGLTGPDLCSALSMLFVLQKVMPRYSFRTALRVDICMVSYNHESSVSTM